MIPLIVMLIMEIFYFIIIAGFCLGIYFKTRNAYKLTKHEGILHFRNIFLYFSFSYLFRLAFIFMMLFYGRPMRMFDFNMLGLILVSYFSTMAILSIVITIFSRKIMVNNHDLNTFMHISAILLSVFVFLTRSLELLLLFQTIVFFFAIAILFLKVSKERASSVSKQNKITYFLLFVFWMFNLFTSGRGDSLELNILIYALSIAIFSSIYLRVNRKLVGNVKKKK